MDRECLKKGGGAYKLTNIISKKQLHFCFQSEIVARKPQELSQTTSSHSSCYACKISAHFARLLPFQTELYNPSHASHTLRRQLGSCSVTRPFLSLRRVWLARLCKTIVQETIWDYLYCIIVLVLQCLFINSLMFLLSVTSYLQMLIIVNHYKHLTNF